MVVRILSSVFFTQLGVKERYLGYLNLLGIPWNLKFLWAPILDGWGTKRGWQIALQAAIGVLTCLIGVLSYMAALAVDPNLLLQVICGVFIALAFVSATNDIAIDGYYLHAIPSRAEQALLSGYRVLAYRLAMVFSRSVIVGLVGWIAGAYFGGQPLRAWAIGFLLSGGTMLLLSLIHRSILPKVEESVTTRGRLDDALELFRQGFLTYLHQPKVHLVLAFIILYKLGDEILFSLVTPFMLRELGVSMIQYAWISGLVGAFATVAGAIFGGWLIKQMSLRRALWPLTIGMNLNIWLYVWLASTKPSPSEASGLTTITLIHGIEQFAAGLGNAALLVFLLTTCAKQFRATHYAIGSAIMSIPGTIVGSRAGAIVEAFGYTNLYIFAFLASIPSMLLIPFVPIREGEEEHAS